MFFFFKKMQHVFDFIFQGSKKNLLFLLLYSENGSLWGKILVFLLVLLNFGKINFAKFSISQNFKKKEKNPSQGLME